LSAAPSDASAGAPTTVTPTPTAPSGEGAALKAATAEPKSTEPAPGAPQSPIDGAAAKPSDPVNLANYTQGELDVLKTLAGRRDQMEAREQELVLRENLLTAAEKKVDQRIAELKKIEERIQTVVSKQETAEEDNLKSLVKVYENMKPKDAARIFENLDGTVLLGVVERMKEAKLALVLALMNPDRAQKLTVELATRRQWPQTVMNSAP
jgi:flagellar motility protein MotE (MotC chaperone)